MSIPSNEKLFMVCQMPGTNRLETLLEQGCNPDARNAAGESPLWVVADRGEILKVHIIFAALLSKYAKQPDKLWDALTLRHDGFSAADRLYQQGQGEVGQIIYDNIRQAANACRDMPRLRHDRTLTVPKLLEVRRGSTYLQTVADQGLLSEIFTADIWGGRGDEMEQAWKQVPPACRYQVDIEAVRTQVANAGANERFGGGKRDWKKGF